MHQITHVGFSGRAIFEARDEDLNPRQEVLELGERDIAHGVLVLDESIIPLLGPDRMESLKTDPLVEGTAFTLVEGEGGRLDGTRLMWIETKGAELGEHHHPPSALRAAKRRAML